MSDSEFSGDFGHDVIHQIIKRGYLRRMTVKAYYGDQAKSDAFYNPKSELINSRMLSLADIAQQQNLKQQCAKVQGLQIF